MHDVILSYREQYFFEPKQVLVQSINASIFVFNSMVQTLILFLAIYIFRFTKMIPRWIKIFTNSHVMRLQDSDDSILKKIMLHSIVWRKNNNKHRNEGSNCIKNDKITTTKNKMVKQPFQSMTLIGWNVNFTSRTIVRKIRR